MKFINTINSNSTIVNGITIIFALIGGILLTFRTPIWAYGLAVLTIAIIGRFTMMVLNYTSRQDSADKSNLRTAESEIKSTDTEFPDVIIRGGANRAFEIHYSKDEVVKEEKELREAADRLKDALKSQYKRHLVYLPFSYGPLRSKLTDLDWHKFEDQSYVIGHIKTILKLAESVSSCPLESDRDLDAHQRVMMEEELEKELDDLRNLKRWVEVACDRVLENLSSIKEKKP